MGKESIILHLSDIQFGAHHRFTGSQTPEPSDEFSNPRYGSNEAFETLASKIEDDLKVLSDTEHLKPNILVISGDLAEWSTEDEYKNVESFIHSLLESEFADITLERTVLVPGNHDINWNLSEAYFLECNAYQKAPAAPYYKKYYFWNQFLERLGALRPQSETPWHGFDLTEFGILVIALDSCMQESHLTRDHYGWLGRKQIEEAVQWLEQLDPGHEKVRIAVFHHNPVRASDNDEENLRNWDNISPLFEANVDMILHGHRHRRSAKFMGNLGGENIIILGAGSAGLDKEALPTCPNQYQIIRLNGNKGDLYCRCYSEQVVGSSGRGNFRPDADQNGKWIYPFTIESISPCSDDTILTTKQLAHSEAPAINEYAKSALSSITERLLHEEEKVGEMIDLNCIDIQTGQSGNLDASFQAWLESDKTRMVILGAGGSGKTMSCLSLCRKVSQGNPEPSWIPLYVDLSRFSAHDDFLKILADCFRGQGMLVTEQQVLGIMANEPLLFFLDAFDEYEKGGAISILNRSYKNFHHLNRGNIKIVITCRSNFFRTPEDIFTYELPTADFDLCPINSKVLKLLRLEPAVVSSALSQHIPQKDIPKWIYELADRPLHLRMLVPLVRIKAFDLAESLERHELYERFIASMLNWDIIRRLSAIVTVDQSRVIHTFLAERFLQRGAASLADIELIYLIEKKLGWKRTDTKFSECLFFFQQSGLLRFEGGQIVFSHKSYREYLVAKYIYDLIVIGDDSFEFTWFTRDERMFITEMLTRPDKDTLSRWLCNEDKYPACNYAIFILGGTSDRKMIPPLMERLHETNDPLIKINCANSLAALGATDVKNTLLGIISGYLIDEKISTTLPPEDGMDGIKWLSKVVEKFGKPVMLIHLCETIDALALIGDADSINTLNLLEHAPDKCVTDEAKGAIRRLEAIQCAQE